jgi:5'-3' exonuclease
MGIKGLKQFLRDKYASCLKPSHLSHFFGQKVALDLLPYMYRYKVSFGETWRHGLFYLFSTFIKNNVHVTVIMDGPMVYKEKEREREKRKAGRSKTQTKIDELTRDLETYTVTREPSPLLCSLSKTSAHRNLLLNVDVKPTVNIKTVEQHIQKLKQQIVSITKEDIEVVKQLCQSLSLPFYMAKQEAESFATYLCRTNQVSLVVTEDTDVLAYGCPQWLSNIAHDGSCLLVSYDEVIKNMNLTPSQFIDFCILCGTDYNETIKGMGPVSALKAVKQYETIESILAARSHDDIHHAMVRRIFEDPCQEAIHGRDHPVSCPVTITYNPLPTEESLLYMKSQYPTQYLINWLHAYPLKFDVE